MVLQLAVGGSAALPWTQIGITWQGVGPGDEMSARWSEESGRGEWSGRTPMPWIRRDTFRRDEHWQVDLQRVPSTLRLISLVLRASAVRSVGVALVPLSGSPEDAILHPGIRIAADEPTVLMTLRRSGDGWTAAVAGSAMSAAGFAEPASGEETPDDGGWQVAIGVPEALKSPVDRVRSTGQTRQRSRVSAVVDVSASMRPWLVNGALAATVTAIQAVACASSRPSLTLALVPDGGVADLPIEAPAGDFLIDRVSRHGMRTGNPRALSTTTHDVLRRGGIVFVVTDDPLTEEAGDERVITVVLSSGAARSERLVPVGESVDIDLLAGDLAIAAGHAPVSD